MLLWLFYPRISFYLHSDPWKWFRLAIFVCAHRHHRRCSALYATLLSRKSKISSGHQEWRRKCNDK